ncbi:MAG: competence/damage-inducible protein A [Bacillota bacterium]|nr:competence/damage-inducible protein A [Bacillota bacterium]
MSLHSDGLPAAAIESAEILAIGTELLMGQITNTNASWLAGRLAELGIVSYYQTVVGDNAVRARQALETAVARADLVIVTGGLGPTEDDISMAVASEVSGVPLRLHLPEWERIQGYFRRRGRRVSENNRKQALLPDPGVVLPNDNGTAPGAVMATTRDGRVRYIMLLPGPPNENRPMFDRYARPLLEARSRQRLVSVYLRLTGIGESDAEQQLADLIHGQTNPTLASYCSTGEVAFRATQYFADRNDNDTGPLDRMVAEIRRRFGDLVYEVGDRSLAAVVSDLLTAHGLTVATAESCTGGLLASAFVDLPGASACFRGGIVAYDNRLKSSLLGVDPELIEREGAVSEAVVLAMAAGGRERTGSDYCLAVSGIAGPGGAAPGKPVGTVWIALASPEGSEARLLDQSGDRTKIRGSTVVRCLDLLRHALLARLRGPESGESGEKSI